MTDDQKRQLNNLIAAVGAGDVQALDGIYRIAAKRMLAAALFVCGSRPAAEDVVSDSFIKLVKSARKYHADDPMAWLIKIVRNTALDFLRKQKRRGEIGLDNTFSIVDERYSTDARNSALALEAAIDRLPPDERRAIKLRYFVDMTIRDIADAMQLSRSSAERLLTRAEQNLKNLLNNGTNTPT